MSQPLYPCPFCGGEAEITRKGSPRVSCVVSCTDCSAHLESSDEGEKSGYQWNTRHIPLIGRLEDVVLPSDEERYENLELNRVSLELEDALKENALMRGMLESAQSLIASLTARNEAREARRIEMASHLAEKIGPMQSRLREVDQGGEG